VLLFLFEIKLFYNWKNNLDDYKKKTSCLYVSYREKREEKKIQTVVVVVVEDSCKMARPPP
jgi:uncharacterized beta-barrel protein YwiB (DUF1934 family)